MGVIPPPHTHACLAQIFQCKQLTRVVDLIMDIRKFFLSSDSQSRHSLSANADPNSSEPNHSTNSSPSMPTVETPDSLSTVTTQSTGSTSTATSTPADLPSPMPFNMQDKLAIVKQEPNQPRDCSYPKWCFSNGNLSFNPS